MRLPHRSSISISSSSSSGGTRSYGPGFLLAMLLRPAMGSNTSAHQYHQTASSNQQKTTAAEQPNFPDVTVSLKLLEQINQTDKNGKKRWKDWCKKYFKVGNILGKDSKDEQIISAVNALCKTRPPPQTRNNCIAVLIKNQEDYLHEELKNLPDPNDMDFEAAAQRFGGILWQYLNSPLVKKMNDSAVLQAVSILREGTLSSTTSEWIKQVSNYEWIKQLSKYKHDYIPTTRYFLLHGLKMLEKSWNKDEEIEKLTSGITNSITKMLRTNPPISSRRYIREIKKILKKPISQLRKFEPISNTIASLSGMPAPDNATFLYKWLRGKQNMNGRVLEHLLTELEANNQLRYETIMDALRSSLL